MHAPMKVRRILKTAAVSIVLASFHPILAAPAPNRGVRDRIQHIVVVMMENRSFDHLLGWHPTADGMQAGLEYTDAGVPALPHIRLDRTLEFLFGDRLR